MTLKNDAKFKEKLTCSFKYDIRNLVNFHPTTQKYENFTSMGSFCPKYEGLSYKNTVIFHNTEYLCQILIDLDLLVPKLP